jgi:hypothetical protein
VANFKLAYNRPCSVGRVGEQAEDYITTCVNSFVDSSVVSLQNWFY